MRVNEKKKLRVYIAGPLSIGNTLKHISKAIRLGDRVLGAGHTPFIPHLNTIWEIVSNRPGSEFLAWDLEWLGLCDVLIRIPGESIGADREVSEAKKLKIPVVSPEEFFKTYGKKR